MSFKAIKARRFFGIRRRRGAHEQAIGRSRGTQTTKIHALTDAECGTPSARSC